VYNYWLGGKDHFAADREVAEKVIAAYPAVVIGARAQRAFLRRAVHYLAATAGVRQFLDIGTGLPLGDNTHEVAQRVAPEARVAYVDNDPVVLSHARALLKSCPEGMTDHIAADLRDPSLILAEAAGILDLSKPVGLLLLGILHCLPDEEDPLGIVARLAAALPPGSYLAISHLASDVDNQATLAMNEYNMGRCDPVYPRTRGEVSRFLDGLDLVDPGLVQVHRWCPETGNPGSGSDIPSYGAVGRKR
jgi:hypothetical protein